MMRDWTDRSFWAGKRVLVLSPTPTHPQNFGNRRRINTVCLNLKALGAAIEFAHYPPIWPLKISRHSMRYLINRSMRPRAWPPRVFWSVWPSDLQSEPINAQEFCGRET